MSRAMKHAWLFAAGWLALPVYFSIELLIRLLNVRRAKPLPEPLRHAMIAADTGVDLARVRLAAPALLPIKHHAITLGHTVFVKYEIETSKLRHLHLLAHELAHVRQREELGRLGMAMAYGRGFADGFSYTNHTMEIDARACADESLPILRARLPKT